MIKKTLYLFLVLIVSAIIMAIPASANEVTLTFDDGSVKAGDILTNQYASEGVTFSGTKVVDTDSSASGTDLGIVPVNGACTINFNPYAKSVSLQFEDAVSGFMAGVLVNGKPVADFQYSANGNTLDISASSSNPIKTVYLTSFTDLDTIQFDNLTYDQIPEFPTVVLPVAAVLGILFIFQRRNN